MNRSLVSAWNAVVLVGMLALGTGAFGATSSSTLLRVSDNNPAYSETVTLTSFTRPTGGLPFLGGQHDMPATGTVSFYEDNGILLQTVNMNHGVAQWSQKFMGGQHTVYAVFNGNSVFPSSISATVSLNVKSALAVPATGAFLGAATNGNEVDTDEEPPPAGIGRPYAINVQYYNNPWTKLAQALDANGVFHPDALLQDDISHGRVPLVSWGCDSSIQGSDALIASGDPTEAAVVTATARALAQYPGPVLLRFTWEFNAFSTAHNPCVGLASTDRTWTPAAYASFIGAWQKIWTIFQSVGATNVVFVWNPTYYGQDGGSYDPHNFYPGNTFVDWIGLDTYQETDHTATFSDNLQPFYTDFTRPQYGDKPMIVAENGAPKYSINNEELQWTYIQGILSDFENNLYPNLKALCWFDLDNSKLDDNNGQGNGGLDAMADLGASPYFSGTSLTASSEGPPWNNGGFIVSVLLASTKSGSMGWPQSSNQNFQVSVPINLTNNGLLPVMNAQIDAITDIAVVRGRGSVTAPVGPFPFSTLTAGQTGMATLNFNWPPSAMCVQMTVHYSGNQGAFKGQNTITVSPFPMGQSCRNNID